MTKADITLVELKRILDKLRMLRGQGTPGLDADIRNLEQIYEVNKRETEAINRMRQSIKYAKNIAGRQEMDWSQQNMAERIPMSAPEIGVAPIAGMPAAQHAKRKIVGTKKGKRPRRPTRRKKR